MDIKSILLHVDRDPNFDERLQMAVNLAADSSARLTGVFSYGPPLHIGYTTANYAVTIISQYRSSQEKAERQLKSRCDDLASAAGIAFEWRREDDAIEMPIGAQARYVDLAIIGQTDPLDPMAQRGYDVAEEVIMTSGGPVLVVPCAGTFPAVGTQVLIAWNGSREAARAVRDAMPFLLEADKVTVFGITEPEQDHLPGSDIAGHLARRGINVEATSTVANDLGVGPAILSAVADHGADLLVMGGYGHARFRELVLGGATRHVLAHMTVPTLFSH